jgi:hypothetical protein
MRVGMGIFAQAEIFAREYLRGFNATAAAKRTGIAFARTPPASGSYVYLLLYPDERQIIYIGKGTRRRMLNHAVSQQLAELFKSNSDTLGAEIARRALPTPNGEQRH